MYDAIIVGGSYAGISAALQLARARRRIAVIDSGKRRNRFAATSHGFLSRDGEEPGRIAAEARRQLLEYATVDWIDGEATSAAGTIDAFQVEAAGQTLHARRLLLAHGVIDELPEVPGLAEQWGRHVFHCPYCHGYELNEGEIGVLAVGPQSMHQALMLPDWGRTTFFTNGAFDPDNAERAQLEKRGTAIEPAGVVAVEPVGSGIALRLEDDRTAQLAGLFVAPRTKPASTIATQLGCDFESGPMSSTILTDDMKETTVPGVYACGDAARSSGNVAVSVADGTMAGTALHRSLMFAGLQAG